MPSLDSSRRATTMASTVVFALLLFIRAEPGSTEALPNRSTKVGPSATDSAAAAAATAGAVTVELDDDIRYERRSLGDVTANIGTGMWYTFFHDPSAGTGGFVQGCAPYTTSACPGSPGVTLSTDVNTPPWSLGSSTCTMVTWTETWYQDSQFQLYVNGRPTATGSTPQGGPDCGEDPNVCYDQGLASRGTYVLPPGRQSITFKIVNPLTADRGAFRLDSYPCPDGNVNFILDDGNWFYFETNSLGEARPQDSRAPAAPWTFYSPCLVDFSIAEYLFSNNQFSIYDSGTLIAQTNVGTRDACSDGYIPPEGCLCYGDLDSCIAMGAAQGTFRLAAGFHNITIKGFALVDYGVFKISTLCNAPTQAPTLVPTAAPTGAPKAGPPVSPPPSEMPTLPKPTLAPVKPPTVAPVKPLPLEVGTGKWYTFYHDPKAGTGGFVQGCSPSTTDECPGAPGVTLPTDVNPPPWTVTSSTCTKVTWTETWFEDNQFQLYVNGRLTRTGSIPSRGPNCGENPNVCYGAGASTGEFVLPPGRQTFTFKIVDAENSDRGAFKLDSFACPAGNVNYILNAGSWFNFETDYLGNTSPINSGDPPTPWTFYSPCPVDFTVAEIFISNNQFSVYDSGVLVGRTNVAAQDRCSNGYIDPDTGCLCEGDFDVCIANGAAHGTFQLPAGSHNITITGYPSLIDYGGFKITSLCDAPTSAPTGSPTTVPKAGPPVSPPPSEAPTLPKPTLATVLLPTLAPVKRPTKIPTLAPLNAITSAPTKVPNRSPTAAPSLSVYPSPDPPAQGPTDVPSSAATLQPTKAPTKAPTKPKTQSPTAMPAPACPTRGDSVKFELWDGDTNSRVSRIRNSRTYCLSGNWNIRAVTPLESSACGAVRISLIESRHNTQLRRFTDATPPFFLYGDNASTGDVYGNTNGGGGGGSGGGGLVLKNGTQLCVRARTLSAKGYSERCFKHECMK